MWCHEVVVIAKLQNKWTSEIDTHKNKQRLLIHSSLQIRVTSNWWSVPDLLRDKVSKRQDNLLQQNLMHFAPDNLLETFLVRKDTSM